MTDSPASSSTSAPRKRRWLRRFVGLGILLLLFLFLAPLLIGLGPVRNKIASVASESLGQRVEIDGAGAFWGKGIDVEGITVHSPDGFDGPLATIRRVHVDVDVLALLGGKVVADVRVVEPHVTLRKDARGRGNQDPMIEQLAQEEEPKPEPAPTPDVRLVVIGGRFETPATDDAPANVVDDVQLTLDLDPSGRKLLALEASLVDAAKGGGNALVKATADLDADTTGPISATVPALDLGRVAQLVENATGLQGLRGSVEATIDAQLQGDQTLAGAFDVRAEDIAARTAGAGSVSVRRLTADTKLRSVTGATEATWTLRIGDMRVEARSGGRTDRFREPAILFEGEGRYQHEDGLVRIAKATLDAGGTATANLEAPLRIETDPAVRIQGKGAARVDLKRLGDLRSLVPALEPLAGGVLNVAFDGRGGEGVDADITVGIDNLRLHPTDYAPGGYADRRIELAMNARRTPEEGTTLTMHRFTSAVAQASFRKDRGLSLRIDPKGAMAADGAFQMRIILPTLSTLVGGAMGLERGERIEGTVTLAGNGVGADERMRLDTTVQAANVVLPRSWDERGTRMNLQAIVRAESSASAMTITVSEVRGMGLSGEGSVTLDPSGDAMRLAEASGRLGLRLREARGWLAPILELESRERLDGQLSSSVRLVESDGARQLSATAQLANLSWERGPGTTPVREPRITMQANLQLAPEGGRHRADELRLETSGLRLDASGSSYVAEPDTDVDATLRLGGDAARLAPLLSALLGEGYEDLQGRGGLSGEMTVRGSPADNGAGLLLNGDLGFGSWSTGGLVVSNAKLALKRPRTADPLTTSFTAGMNKGTARVDGSARLGGAMIPWRATAKLARVDTSTLLVGQGMGRYLAFALPALLPAGKNTPVLSGLLDADLEGSAPSIEDPGLSNGLQGKGRIHMSGGEIKQSTLFGGGGGQLGKVISVLNVAVPEAGRALQELSRAVTFSSLDSRFRVANKVLLLDEAKLIGQSAHIDMKGRVDFEQRVALETNVAIQGGGGRALAKALPGGVIPLRVRGTLENPQVTPNVDLGKLAAGGLTGKVPGLLDDLKKKKLPGGIPNPFGR